MEHKEIVKIECGTCYQLMEHEMWSFVDASKDYEDVKRLSREHFS